MPTLSLTARSVTSLKPLPGKRVEYFDAAVPGLALRVTERGAKSWTLLYRHRGRLRRLTLASAAVLSLADARSRARDLLHAASHGADPATQKQEGRRAETIGDLAEQYLEKWAKPRKKSWKADDNLLRRRILPHWRHRAIADITRADVRALVEQVADAGAPVVANRVAALISKMFSFALDRDLVAANPAVRIPRPGVEYARDRVLTELELQAFWAATDALDPAMRAFYRLRLVTAQRGGELASMQWADVNLDAAWWTIPAAHAKNGLAHRVPLSPLAVQTLRALKAKDVDQASNVFAGARGKRQQAEAAAKAFAGIPDAKGHDLRRTAASFMASGGISRLVIGKVLNHAESSITAVYDRHSYDPEKRAALDWWAARVLALMNPKKRGASIRPFDRRA